MSKTLEEREKQIIDLARNLISRQDEFNSEAKIDAEFLFRFGPGWCDWVTRIRRMIANLLGYSKYELMSEEDKARFWVHLDANADLSVGMEVSSGGTKYKMETERGKYRGLNHELNEQLNDAIREAISRNDSSEVEKLNRELWQEANQTAKIQSEIWRLVRAYQIVPLSSSEMANFPLNKLKGQYQSALNWILHGLATPSFLYDKTVLLENPTDKKVRRVIRPHKWVPNFAQKETSKIRVKTRIRTWVIYYLTRRGGGKKTEQSAIDLWNQEFNDTLEKRNYRTERDRLFEHGSKKG